MEKLNKLLNELSIILADNNRIEQEKKDRGEMFNIFNVLGLRSNDEVKLHSAFLAELLNAKGEHGQGDKFLRSFISCTEIDIPEFQTEKSHATVELNIGKITETEGGRIDIIITSGRKAIIIENKLDAADQPNQLVRYNNYAKRSCENYKLLYLTKNGKEPSEEAKGDLQSGTDFDKISYRDTITKWLKECLELSKGTPIYFSIFQYLTIIYKLTNQTMSNNAAQIIDKITESKENFETALEVSRVINQAKGRIISKYFPKYMNSALKRRGLDFTIKGDIKSNDIEQWFTINSNNDTIVSIQFNLKRRRFIFGTSNATNTTSAINSKIESEGKGNWRSDFIGNDWSFSEWVEYDYNDDSLFVSLQSEDSDIYDKIIDRVFVEFKWLFD